MERIELSVTSLSQQPRQTDIGLQYNNKMELDDCAYNLLAAGLPEELQTIGGMIAFAYEKFNLHITPKDIQNVFKIADTQRGPLVKIRFGSMAARTAFYKARTRLGPRTSIWFNEDLTRANEILAYQARALCAHKHLARTWTYLGQVFIQKTEGCEPTKIFKKEDLPHHETLDSITTPRQTPARFTANKDDRDSDRKTESPSEASGNNPGQSTSKSLDETTVLDKKK